MNDRSRLPLHRAEDHIPLTPDELSRYAQLSRAFVQVCLDSGCTLTDGKISQALLLNWLAENYVAVRKLAGLPELASIDGVEEPAYTDLQMANMMLTMLEFARSRATRLEEKSQITTVIRLIDRAVEC